MDKELVAVDINTLWVYDFLKDGESKEDLLRRANDYREKEVKESGERLVYAENKNPENTSFFKDMYDRALNICYKVMTFDKLMELKRERYLSDSVQRITEEEWNDKLDILPPLYWCTIDGVNEFCLREMYDATFTTQYARYNGKYYSKMVDSADKSTWIHNFKKEMDDYED